ncbi:hypothetical protein J3E68DRAFT_134585 [Trichoderma sp. SZMC 28012]
MNKLDITSINALTLFRLLSLLLLPFHANPPQQLHPTSQLADAAMGGYCFPFFSTLGSQVHHSFSSTESSTPGMWFPQPHQVALSKAGMCKHKALFNVSL